jgi:hypothetical protein
MVVTMKTQPLIAEDGEVVGEIEILPDPGGPPGNQGVVGCGACGRLGWFMDQNERGYRIIHAHRPWPCRAAL